MDTREKDLEYFQEKLQEHLNTNFPEKAYDTKFILQRANWALNAYQGCLLGGNAREES